MPIRGNYNPGAGGWPTIRYFNADTGVGGAPYEKKTEKAMCEELKDIDHMFAYVETAAGTSACDVEDLVGCSDKQKDYIGKWKDGKSLADYEAQNERLAKMLKSKLTPEAMNWIKLRMKVAASAADYKNWPCASSSGPAVRGPLSRAL